MGRPRRARVYGVADGRFLARLTLGCALHQTCESPSRCIPFLRIPLLLAIRLLCFALLRFRSYFEKFLLSMFVSLEVLVPVLLLII